jgi:hypothetical protein
MYIFVYFIVWGSAKKFNLDKEPHFRVSFAKRAAAVVINVALYTRTREGNTEEEHNGYVVFK